MKGLSIRAVTHYTIRSQYYVRVIRNMINLDVASLAYRGTDFSDAGAVNIMNVIMWIDRRKRELKGYK